MTYSRAVPDVAVILLNWNGWRDTVRCLSSLRLSHAPHRVIVVDNASTDDSVARIREAFPDVTLLQSGTNGGFAFGNNVGIRHALATGADFVWLLNNDTCVTPRTLSAMLDVALADPCVGVVGSVIRDIHTPHAVQAWGGGRVMLPLGYVRHFREPAQMGATSYLTGASLLIRREVLEHVGLLDEGFFMYWEDTDYAFRARRAGWGLAVAGNSDVLHAESSTAGKASIRQVGWRNTSALRFYFRHAPQYLPGVLIGIAARSAKAWLTRIRRLA